LRQRSRVERDAPTACAARSAVSPAARAVSHRATASRLLSASISGVFAARRRDADRAERIRWPGRPKTCMGFSCDSSFDNPSLSKPHLSIKPSHICLIPDMI
jgi:hypothetical protein